MNSIRAVFFDSIRRLIIWTQRHSSANWPKSLGRFALAKRCAKYLRSCGFDAIAVHDTNFNILVRLPARAFFIACAGNDGYLLETFLKDTFAAKRQLPPKAETCVITNLNLSKEAEQRASAYKLMLISVHNINALPQWIVERHQEALKEQLQKRAMPPKFGAE